MPQIARFMCLGCGRFWALKDARPVICPYCGDAYYVDNVLTDVPPPLGGWLAGCMLECGHWLESDIPGDIKVCPICRHTLKYGFDGPTVKDWQRRELERLGISRTTG